MEVLSVRRIVDVLGGVATLGIAALLVALLASCTGDPGGNEDGAVPTGIRFLTAENGEPASTAGSDSTEGFAYATQPRAFRFPADHAAHPEYRSEWWYFTGNLWDDRDRHFGFELTLFRFALAPTAPVTESAWSTNQAYMAHLAITDTEAGEMIAEERLTRGAAGLAGADVDPLRIWVESWSIEAGPDGGTGTFVLDAMGDRIGLRLDLDAEKPAVPHGNDGVDPKGPEPGNASYYYSITRLAANGEVSVDGERRPVRGLAWMDREWSTSALSPNVEGWDWFALQLSDDTELMIYRLRGTDGSTSPFSGGSLVDAEGRRLEIGAEDFALEPLDEWRSRRSGMVYPIAWKLSVPGEDLELEVRPRIDDQEILLSVRYWEGAVEVRGRARGEAIDGNGYLELAGY